MLRRLFLSFAAVLAFAGTVSAQDDSNELFDVMGLPEIIDVMRAEGQVYGETIARDMFPSGMTPRWAATVAQIYDPVAMTDGMRAGFIDALQGKDVAPMLAFYRSDLGQQIVMLEIVARQAMLDPAIETASKDIAAQAARDNTPRYQQITDFIAANDLIETNVVGGLNSNFAFVSALVGGGAVVPGLTADSLLADVWAQEPQIRDSTTEWVYAFLLLAYEPLSDAQLDDLTAFSQTRAGKDLTSALFLAFDALFEGVSRDLGSAASGFVISQDL